VARAAALDPGWHRLDYVPLLVAAAAFRRSRTPFGEGSPVISCPAVAGLFCPPWCAGCAVDPSALLLGVAMKKTKAGRAISAQSGAQCRVPGRRSAPVRPRFLRLRGPRRDGPMVAASDEVIAFRSPAIHPYEPTCYRRLLVVCNLLPIGRRHLSVKSTIDV